MNAAWEDAAAQVAALTDQEFVDRVTPLLPADRDEALRLRFRHDRMGFARYLWPDRFTLPFNACHEALFGASPHPYQTRPKTHDAIAAPRGIGKSSVSSFVDVVHRVVYDTEAFVVIMAAVQDLAVELVTDIMETLQETESPLRDLYGRAVVLGGKSDFTVSIAGRPSIRILARSFGQTIRGVKHRGIRPTLIIVDDGERSDRVRSAIQRGQSWKFLNDDVLKAGLKPGTGGTETKIRGTVLHVDSMLATALTHPGWDGQRFASLISWPDRQDLWAQCGRYWCDLTLCEYRRAAARAFYEANREEMDRGARVLDPVAEPLFDLYELIWAEGLASFLREKQNQPRDPASQFFDSARFARFRVQQGTVQVLDTDGKITRATALSALKVNLRLDPIPGKELGTLGDETGSGQGDFAAIAAIGRDQYGYGYLLQVWLARCRDTDQLAAMFEIGEQWGATRASIESNGFQRLFGRDYRRMVTERRAAGRFWQMALDEDVASTSKEDRIASLEPSLTNGWLLVNEALDRRAFEQFDEFPCGSHDDAPDAVEGAWRLSRGPATAQRRIA